VFWNFLRKRRDNRERILALDLLRGTFLIEIITAHVAWHPSVFTFISGGNQLPASAAEGFFAISGTLVGYLYGPRVLKDTKKVFKKIWRRAALLWALATFFTIAYTAWATLDPHNAVYQSLYTREAWRFLVNTVTLRYSYGWAEFLNRYAMFMLIAPFAVWLIAKGRAWIVALVSCTVWFFLREKAVFLPFSAWQIVFMNAIILGYYLPHLEEWFKSFSRCKQRIIFTTVCSVGLISYVYSIFQFALAPNILPPDSQLLHINSQVLPYFDKDHLAPARIGIGVVWFAALYMVYRRYEKPISKYTRGVLEVFGRQSLFVYTFHAFILFNVDLYLAPTPSHALWQNTLVTLAVLLIIYIAAYNRVHITEYGKKLYRNRSTTQVP
jgi:hypothetical protein